MHGGQFGHFQTTRQAASAYKSFCICLPNFVQIGPSATELWRHIHFSRWRPQHRNSTSGYGFRDFAHLGRSKSTCTPNFGEISQSTAEILLLPVYEANVRHVGILIPVPTFTFASPSACHSASAYQICLVVLGVFTDEVPMLKSVLSLNFPSPVENRPKICVFWENGVKM